MTAVVIRGTPYPVLLPKLRDPRLHLAATIISLQVIGQVGFQFQLSIAQILVALATCGVLEFTIAFFSRRVIMWPASALLTGNGVAFVLRVPGTQHGDWWSLRGWWIFAGTAALALLSKYVIKWRGEHIFNPSNIGLVVCFLVLGRTRAAPLDFWWGPMSWWLVLALCVIVAGGFTILSRLRLLRVALSFWATFAAGIGLLALTGHVMLAHWHLGPITGFHFWWILVTSPEVLVFLFFMITDPKTAPQSPKARLWYGLSLGVLGALMIAPTTTEYASKVALLSSLAVVCVAMVPLRELGVPRRRVLILLAPAVAVAYVAAIVLAPGPAVSAVRAVPPGTLPPITILPSHGVQTQLDQHTAELIAHDLLASTHVSATENLSLHLAPGSDQAPPYAVASSEGQTYRLDQRGNHWQLEGAPALPTTPVALPTAPAPNSLRLQDVAAQVGLDFQQGAFRYGRSNDYRAMMGGGVCWLDFNGDGWLDLYAVNSYSSSDTDRWEANGGLPRSALYENEHGRFVDVSKGSGADLAVQGDGCAAGDLNGDGRPDLVVTTTTGVDLLWNDGNGRFTEKVLPTSGWYTGAAIADVNGDGRPDLFVAGYSDPNEPVPGSLAGFPTNLAGVRDLLYLNEGGGHFREVGSQAGLEAANLRHGLGALFLDYNHDGRPDLYVANDEDPNQLYENVPWPGGAKADPAGLGFRFEERGAAEGVADPYAGMGIASADGGLFVTNSRDEPAAAYRPTGGSPAFANARPAVDPALGAGFAGWGASFVDLANAGTPDLVLAAGAIPVTSLDASAEPVRVLGPRASGKGYGDLTRILGSSGLKLNGRGLAAADADNDGRLEIAINTIGGRLVLLRPTGPSGHWLDVRLSRFTPGAIVTATLPDGAKLEQTVRAGGSYLSSEDPRVHFGLGKASRVKLFVRYPSGASTQLSVPSVDRIVTVTVAARPLGGTGSSAPISGCTPRLHGQSVARVWNETAVDALRASGLSEPVQARDLFHLSAALWDAWAAYDPSARGYFVTTKSSAPNVLSARGEAMSYAAYRLLLWRVSFGSNLDRSFGLLEARLRSLCLSPSDLTSAGSSPDAVGNRIAAAAVAYGQHDGSAERLHYADPDYTPQNGPLVVAQAGSAVHDPTFWQPLALAQVAAHGAGFVPAAVQSFAGAQWGGVRGLGSVVAPKVPWIGPSSSRGYRQDALAVLRATAGAASPGGDASPLGWNVFANRLPDGTGAGQRLARDVRVGFALNGALANAAIAAWGAKRTSQAPRPISMIRYLAFERQLPLVPGLVERDGSTIRVKRAGEWVAGDRWTPLAATPASPGGVSEDAAFAWAAADALRAATGRSFTPRAEQLAGLGLAAGTDVPAAVTAGRAAGIAAAQAALTAAKRYGG
jgi:Na+-translocating ferredoxin:NAD+ oxidoreductase RnfD subunit